MSENGESNVVPLLFDGQLTNEQHEHWLDYLEKHGVPINIEDDEWEQTRVVLEEQVRVSVTALQKHSGASKITLPLADGQSVIIGRLDGDSR